MFEYNNNISGNEETAFALFLFVPKKKLSIFKKPNKKLLKYLTKKTDYRLNKEKLDCEINKLNRQIIREKEFFGKHVIYRSFEEAKQKMYEQLVKSFGKYNKGIYAYIEKSNAVIVKINFMGQFHKGQIKDIDESKVYKFDGSLVETSGDNLVLESSKPEPKLIKNILCLAEAEKIGREFFSKKYKPKTYKKPAKYPGIKIKKFAGKHCIIL